jgi:ABC-type sugar transport system ATPase subunit
VAASLPTAPDTRTPEFGVRHLQKSYGDTTVLSGIDIEFRPGEVHALLGANGAGKSTLIKCLAGATAPTAGTISIDGRTWGHLSPRGALEAGVAVIYQHFSLIGSLSVADNVFLGSELTAPGGRVRKGEEIQAAGELLDSLGVDISATARVGSLPIAMQQLVEIAKAIHHRAKLLILDEPTASLSDAESRALLDHVRKLREQGIAIVYVTHLLEEVFEIADRVTVLRDGFVSLSRVIDEVESAELIEAITGDTQEVGREGSAASEEVVLSLRDLAGPQLGPISLDLHRGEIVGVFGLLGSGRTELLETLFGIRARDGGVVTLAGREFHPRKPSTAISRGLALVPGERLRQSMLPSLSTSDNLLLAGVRSLSRFGVRDFGAERRTYQELATRLQIRAAGPQVPAWTLSGGNQQKVAVGRWLLEELEVLMLDDPTQGIDVGSRAELYRVLQGLARERGCAVLFTSSSPEEVIALADRALVLRRGRIAAELNRAEIQEDRLLSLAHNSEVK